MSKLKKVKTQKETQSAFSKKWKQVEKKQTRNLNYKNKLKNFYDDFKRDVLPFEHKFCDAVANETNHLTGFISRKSFTNWQREELSLWIESNLDLLRDHPFTPDGTVEKLSGEYSKALLGWAKTIPDEEEIDPEVIFSMRGLLEELEVEDNYSDEELDYFIRNPQIFTEHIESIMMQRMAKDAENEDFEDDLDDDFFQQFEEEFINSESFQHFQDGDKSHQKKLKDLFNGSLLKKCYKKLANILHPDKEQNPELKEKKSDLMAILAQAKKEKDAFTIISMYQEHVPDNDLNLDENVCEGLLALIDEKLSQLDVEHSQVKHDPCIENMLWSRLGGRSKKIREEKQFLHILDLKSECAGIARNIGNMKNMKMLNRLLSDRYDIRNASPFMHKESFQNFMDMMDEGTPDDCPF